MEKSTSFDTVKSFLEGQSGLERGDGATDDEIRELESAWGGRLPDDYALFLKTFGYAVYGIVEIPGLGSGRPTYVDVMHLANALWHGAARLPKELLPFYASGGDWYYCISRLPQTQPVVLWSFEFGEEQPYDETYESWSQWFVEHLIESNHISYHGENDA